jgi:hypothetical protein
MTAEHCSLLSVNLIKFFLVDPEACRAVSRFRRAVSRSPFGSMFLAAVSRRRTVRANAKVAAIAMGAPPAKEEGRLSRKAKCPSLDPRCPAGR